MFRLLTKKMRRWQATNGKNQTKAEQNASPIDLSKNLEDNLSDIRSILGQS